MKKLTIFLLMTLMAAAAWAVEFSSGNLMYDASGTTAYITGLSTAGKGTSGLSLTIPGTITYNGTTYRVWGINKNAFLNATNITSVEMKWGTRIISENAFKGCTGITYVRMPSSIFRIDANAFNGCTALKYVYYAGFNFPEGTINAGAFPANSGMELRISTQSKRTTAQYKAATGWSRFATVTQSIYAYDEYMNDGGMYAIGYSDIKGPSDVRSATLMGYNTGGSNTSSGTVYRAGWAQVTPNGGNITFSIDTIGQDAFQGQTTLKTIDLTNAINLKSFKSQGSNTGIQNVTTITLPKSNFGYSTGSFAYFTSLTEFVVASGSTSFSTFQGSLYNYAKTTLIKVPNAKSGSMSYPSTLTNVWSCSHLNCTKITSVSLPYGVRSIGFSAFNNTTSLDYTYIPSSVTNLSNDRVFSGTKSNNYIYCNMANPPTVTASSYFGTTSGMNLYVPYGKIDTYKNAGWTGFANYNSNNYQAYDIYSSSLAYTVTSTAATTVNGTSYAGRVKLVSNGNAANNSTAITTVSIPASITYNGKTYAVTMIGEDAFNNHTANFTVTGCANIDTIGDYAFQAQPVIAYPFTHNLKRIGNRAFQQTGLTGTVAIPYGVQWIGSYAFANGKYSRIVVPGGVASYCDMWCNTSTLTEIVYNMNHPSYTGWDFTGVPSNCYIRVPTGVVGQYKNNSKFSGRGNYVTAGAYDFVYNNNYDGTTYFCTITSTSPRTYDGTTYNGTAKYVYHPNIQNATNVTSKGLDVYEEDRTVSSDVRQYLITELGDSLLYGSKFTSVTRIPAAVTHIGQSAFYNSAIANNNLALPSGLTYIGANAFRGSKITGEIKIPASVTTIDHDAFWNVPLTALYFPGNKPATLGNDAWYNATNFTVWVPNEYANNYLTEATKWGTNRAERLAVYIKPAATSVMFSSVVPTNLAGSNVTAYYASGYDKSQATKQVTLTKANQAPANTGLLLDDLTSGKEYRISRPSGSVSAPMTNYFVGNPSSTVNVNNQTVGFRWDATGKKFVKPTSAYNLPIGQAYLKLTSTEASGLTEVYTNLWPKSGGGDYLKGDVNGSGNVDIADINIIINIMLNKDSASKYGGRANVDGQGGIDIADVNAVINIMLNK